GGEPMDTASERLRAFVAESPVDVGEAVEYEGDHRRQYNHPDNAVQSGLPHVHGSGIREVIEEYVRRAGGIDHHVGELRVVQPPADQRGSAKELVRSTRIRLEDDGREDRNDYVAIGAITGRQIAESHVIDVSGTIVRTVEIRVCRNE